MPRYPQDLLPTRATDAMELARAAANGQEPMHTLGRFVGTATARRYVAHCTRCGVAAEVDQVGARWRYFGAATDLPCAGPLPPAA